jgi:hypothetical protein
VLIGFLIVIYVITRSRTILCSITKLQFRLRYCGSGNDDPTIDLFLNLETWLESQPSIRNAIRWQAPNRRTYSYSEWTDAQKAQLASACKNLRRANGSGLPEAPPFSVFQDSVEIWSTNIEPDLAWKYYIAYLAQSIMAEARSWLGWSLNEYTDAELALLFDSRYLYTYRDGLGKYIVTKMYNNESIGISDYGAAMPGDPGRIFAFLYDSEMLGATRRQTIENLMGWCRTHLVHYNGVNDPANLLNYWQYGGFAPVERMIQGTICTSQPAVGLQHWTAGCWGTTAFLRLVLRTANIPVLATRLRCPDVRFHSTPYFASENLYLSHGDDLYGHLSHATPPIPESEYLIDQARFDVWFGDAVSDEQSCNNVGRRQFELALQYLPNWLLRSHCQDLADGRDHASSSVYEVFKSNYTVAELEAAGLWDRMNSKIASFGGCDSIPETPGLYG